jgi:hypothetical protein
MYPACLIGSRAVALMGIRTHLCVLLTDRLASNHLRMDLGCNLSSDNPPKGGKGVGMRLHME